MKNFIFTILLFSCFSLNAQTFADFIDYVNSLPVNERQAEIDNFADTASSFPFIEGDTAAHFIWLGPEDLCEILGDFTFGYQLPLTKIEGADFWYISFYTFASDARLEYNFILNNEEWLADPLNPLFCGWRSELRMPCYIPPAEVEYYPLLSHGTTENTYFHSSILNNSRTINVYLPPGYNESAYDYPVVIVHDGTWFYYNGMVNTLDYLINLQLIDPVIAIFVPPLYRDEEYAGIYQDQFTDFIAEEVMTWADETYRVSDNEGAHAMIGASAGGNITLWISMLRPEIFGHAGPLSPAIESDIFDYFSETPEFELDIYMIRGIYDGSQIRAQVEIFRQIMEVKDYDFIFAEYPEGHSMGMWRAHIDDALMFFYPFTGAFVNVADAKYGNDQIKIVPNPSNGIFNLEFESEHLQVIEISITDLSGKLLNNEQLIISENTVRTFNLSDHSYGIYLLNIRGKTFNTTKKIIIQK